MMSENLYGHLLSGVREMYSIDKLSCGERNVYTTALQYVYSMSFGPDVARNYTIRKDGTMTCQPKNTPTLLGSDDSWLRDTRQEIKVGRALRAIFQPSGLQYMDHVIEYLAHYLKAQYQFNGQIKIHPGSDIRKYYYEGCYLRNQGSLNSSCMKYESSQDYLDILADNAQIIVAHSNTHPDKIIGRALLWTTTCDTKVMDRIYGNETTIQAFKDFAKENNFVYKTYQNYSTPAGFMINGESCDKSYRINANPYNYNKLPYMDTFKYYNNDSTQLNNYNGTFELTSTDGYPPHEDDDLYVTLHDGSRVHRDDACWVEGHDEYYLHEDVTYSEYEDCYNTNDDTVESANHGPIHHENLDFTYIDYSGEYHHQDDVIYIDFDSDSYVISEVIAGLYDKILFKDDVPYIKVDVNRCDEIDSAIHDLPEYFQELNIAKFIDTYSIIIPSHVDTIKNLHKLNILNHANLQYISNALTLPITEIQWNESNT